VFRWLKRKLTKRAAPSLVRKLDPAQLWVEALRSGDYAQARGHLRSENGYCCLGVACDTYRRVTGKGRWDRIDGGLAGSAYYTFDPESGDPREAGTLPDVVRDWLGLDQGNGTFVDREGNLGTLTSENDEAKLSLAQIADIVESHPQRLFK
jgi:hypothetical protein